MEVAIVGGGPGGCWSAILLARRGHAVTLIDPQAPWEKPCGGGITTKALQQFKMAKRLAPSYQNLDHLIDEAQKRVGARF